MARPGSCDLLTFRLAGGFLLGVKLSEAASYRHVLLGEWNLECPRLGGALSSSIFFNTEKKFSWFLRLSSENLGVVHLLYGS